jgi:hypothetical protein
MPRDLTDLLTRLHQLHREPAPRDRQSQKYWARARGEREALAEARRNGLPDPPREPSIWFACNDGGEAVTIGVAPQEYSKLATELRESGVLVGEFHTREEALAAAHTAMSEREAIHGKAYATEE